MYYWCNCGFAGEADTKEAVDTILDLHVHHNLSSHRSGKFAGTHRHAPKKSLLKRLFAPFLRYRMHKESRSERRN
jgi:hypothetical protein